MLPSKEKGKNVMKCSSCGYKEAREDMKVREKSKHEEKDVEIVEKEFTTSPTCKEECPKCGNDTAYYELQQTRSADEPPTKFLKCTKCKYTWRDYR